MKMEECIPLYGAYGNGDYTDSNVTNFSSYPGNNGYEHKIHTTAANISFLIKQGNQPGGNGGKSFHLSCNG